MEELGHLFFRVVNKRKNDKLLGFFSQVPIELSSNSFRIFPALYRLCEEIDISVKVKYSFKYPDCKFHLKPFVSFEIILNSECASLLLKLESVRAPSLFYLAFIALYFYYFSVYDFGKLLLG